MKKVIKNLIGFVITVVLIIGGINRLGYLTRPTNTDITINAIDTFHDMPENSFEVIGYGSSHMWRGLSPIQLYNGYGIGAYNYGCNWQKINTTLLFLKDSLKTQSPKVVLIETYFVNEHKADVEIDGEIYYTTAIEDNEDKKLYLEQCFGSDKDRYLSYYVPLCAFHDNWTNLTEASFEKDFAYTFDFYKTMGLYEFDNVTPVTIPDPSTFRQSELSDETIEVLDEMVETCNENGIEIIFYTAPWQGEYEYGAAMQKYAEQNECAYINMFECVSEIGLDENIDFSDEGHLNISGSAKVSDYLGNYIVNNYDVTDYRKLEHNIWEMAQK